MKILVLNGSPKREKSDTMHITSSFLEGMKDAASQEIHVINVIDCHIEYCTGCFACKRNGGTCIHDDDMRDILNEILRSDLLLFSFPLYCYGMPSPLKALLDRTMPLSSMAIIYASFILLAKALWHLVDYGISARTAAQINERIRMNRQEKRKEMIS